MKENGRFIPPSWCKDICTNSGELVCVYDCAAERQGRYFFPDPDLKLEDIAPFPVHDWQANSSPKERQIMAGLYLAKLVEAATGVPTDPQYESLKKELDGASYDRTWEIVHQLLDEARDILPTNGEGADLLKDRKDQRDQRPTDTRQTIYQVSEQPDE